MAFTAHFQPKGLNTAKYDEVIRRLQQAGAGAPAGRLGHLCFGPTDALQVIDIWDTPENLQAFGATLFPILAEVGVDPGQPEIQPLHNEIKG